SIESPRRVFALCSPSTQRIASETLVLPQPLGPITPVMPSPNSTLVRSTNDLKPWISSRWRNIPIPFRGGRQRPSSAPRLRPSSTGACDGQRRLLRLRVGQRAHVEPETAPTNGSDHGRICT